MQIRCALFLLLFAFSVPALAEPLKPEPIRFPAGRHHAVLKGRVKGDRAALYALTAEAGQTLRLRLTSAHPALYFNLYAPGQAPGGEALAVSSRVGEGVPDLNLFSGRLSASGTYLVSIYLYRAAARRQEGAKFTLNVDVLPAEGGAADPVQSEFADGLQGGPDFWRVTSARPVGLYAKPADPARRLAWLADGTILRNRGCRAVQGGRWCQVEASSGPALSGWVEGAGLRESAPPSDRLVPGTDFHATGSLPCATAKGQPTGPCRFGVIRHGSGRAELSVWSPQGEKWVIRFENGVPAGADTTDGQRLSFSHQSDLFLISIGAARFEVPEAVIHGG